MSDIDHSRVELALQGLLRPMDLSGDEQEEYFDRLEVLSETPSAEAEAFYADLRKRGVGVGMDEAGNLVYQLPEGDEMQTGTSPDESPAVPRPIDEWSNKTMENMRRMASDEEYRLQIAKGLS